MPKWRARPGAPTTSTAATTTSTAAPTSWPSARGRTQATAAPARSGAEATADPARGGDEVVVGSVLESREAHLSRHGGGSRSCGRCRWYIFGHRWLPSYGSVGGAGAPGGRAGPRARVEWLAERPSRWGGAWGLGCRLCADFAWRAEQGDIPNSAGPKRKWRGRLGTAWSRHEVRTSTLQAEHVRQHATSETHRLAVAHFLRPDAPIQFLLQETVEDEGLLRGAVPSVEDWARAWHAARSPVSWAGSQRALDVEHKLRQVRDRPVQSRSLQKMARVMMEVIRAQQRQWIRECSCICLSFDDRKGYKLVRFRCDSPAPAAPASARGDAAPAPARGDAAPAPRRGDAAPASAQGDAAPASARADAAPASARSDAAPASARGDAAPAAQGDAGPAPPRADADAASRGGLLGCVECLQGASLESLAQDYGDRAANEVTAMVDKFRTLLGGELDTALRDKFLAAVRTLCVDGALLKVCERLRAGSMRNVILIIRDPSHAIRIAVKEPLVRTGRFEAQWRRLFADRHALLKDVMYSRLWQARLEDCQRLVLNGGSGPCLRAGPVTHIMRHFSYAPQRFESDSDPRRKFVCCLNAIALLLADVAGDARRTKDERDRARKGLDVMTARDALEAGLAADYSEVGLRFLRKFDSSVRDPATTSHDVAEFERVLRRLFVDMHVLRDPGTSDPRLGIPDRTMTRVAMEQCADLVQFRIRREVKMLWSKTSKAEIQETLSHVSSVAQDAIARLRACFFDGELYMALGAFAVDQWERALDPAGRALLDTQALRARLLRLARRVGAAWGLDRTDRAWIDFASAAVRCRRALRAAEAATGQVAPAAARGGDGQALAAAQGPGNRRVWTLTLAREPEAWWGNLVRWYLSVNDSTGDVDRSLGRHTDCLAHHLGALEDDGRDGMAQVCLAIHGDGPQSIEEIVRGMPRRGERLLTDFSRRCARVWIATRGRRFGYRQRKDAGRRDTGLRMRGSATAARLAQRRALEALGSEAGAAAAARGADGATVVGIDRARLARGAARHAGPAATKSLRAFRNTTAQILNKKASSRRPWAGYGQTPPPQRTHGGINGPVAFKGPLPGDSATPAAAPGAAPPSVSPSVASAAARGQGAVHVVSSDDDAETGGAAQVPQGALRQGAQRERGRRRLRGRPRAKRRPRPSPARSLAGHHRRRPSCQAGRRTDLLPPGAPRVLREDGPEHRALHGAFRVEARRPHGDVQDSGADAQQPVAGGAGQGPRQHRRPRPISPMVAWGA